MHRESSVTRFNYNINVAHLGKKNTYFLISYLTLATANKNFIRNDGSTHIRGVFNYKKIIAFESFGQYQFDKIRTMDNRFLGGLGIRYRLKYSDKIDLATGTAIMYEYEKWLIGEETPSDLIVETNWIKSSTYIRMRHKINENINYNVVGYYQARFNYFFKPRIIFEGNTNIKISKKFSLTLSCAFTYDPIPVAPVNNLVLSTKSSLKLKI